MISFSDFSNFFNVGLPYCAERMFAAAKELTKLEISTAMQILKFAAAAVAKTRKTSTLSSIAELG